MRQVLTITLCLFLFASGVSAHWEERDLMGQFMFGYAGVDENLMAYTAEIEGNNIPTNVQLVTVNAPTDDIGSKVGFLNSRGQRAIVVLDNLLFRPDSTLKPQQLKS